MELRFGFGDLEGNEKTQKEVADMLGISQSYISRLEKKIMALVYDEIKKKKGMWQDAAKECTLDKRKHRHSRGRGGAVYGRLQGG